LLRRETGVTRVFSAADTEGDVPARRPGTLHDYVAEAVGEAILAGRLRPGERIRSEALAKTLGVSHIPVREALQSLVGQGQVVKRTHRGFYVPAQSQADFADAHLWREVLEEKAYTLACRRITREDLKRMRSIYEQMGEAIDTGDWVRHAKLNRAFHMLPVKCVGSERLERFLTYLWNVCDLYFATMIRAGGDIPRLQEQHLELTRAFAAHDADRVNDVMRRHRSVSFAVISPAIPTGEPSLELLQEEPYASAASARPGPTSGPAGGSPSAPLRRRSAIRSSP
jgi:DNA-binding GntR family transcriptional regulator